jgi:hypothetical protein
MSSTETSSVDDLARSLFDTTVVPIAAARQTASAAPYFPTAPDPALDSYFVPVTAARSGAPQAVDFPGGGEAAGLIEALAASWTAGGHADLAALAPGLRQIAAAMDAERGEENGDVDIYCYTMF